jgi:hypothetical protein
MYFLLRALRGGRPRSGTQPGAGTARCFLYAMVGSVFYGLGFYTYIAFRITPLFLAVPLLF